MKVLLLNPPSEKGVIRTGRWVRKTRGNQSWPPIWLAYCTGLLQKNGFDCQLLDASMAGFDNFLTYAYVKAYEPNYIIFYWSYDTVEADLAFADSLTRFSKIILVGPWSYCMSNVLLKTKHVNVMTYGEFEHTVLEILKTKHYSDVPGVIWRNHINGQIIINKPRPLCTSKELDEIPFVTSVYNQFLDIKKYRQTSFRYPFVDLLTARGCPHRCAYCLWPRSFQDGSSYRSRSIKNVISELQWIRNNLPEVKQVFFQDDTMPKKHAVELSQAILDANLGKDFTWSCYSRAELDYDTLKLMKDSGLRTLHVGYETNDQKTLDLIQKDITVAQMETFANAIKKLDLWTCAGFMIFPWQTKEQIYDLIKWVKNTVQPRRFSFTQLFAYPNTPINRIMQEKQVILTPQEMTKLEKEGFKQYYLRNPHWFFDTVKHPREWRNVVQDATGLLHFMRGND